MIREKIKSFILKLIERIEASQYKGYDFDEDDITKKIIDEIALEDVYLEADTGQVRATKIMKTQPYHVWRVKTANHEIECADNHILFNKNLVEVFVKDLKTGDCIMTEDGPEQVTLVEKLDAKVCMFDIEVDSYEHRYYTNGVLSHNTVTSSIFIAWYICFQFDKNILVLAHKLSTAHEIIDKVKHVLKNLPFFLKPGLVNSGVGGMRFDNGVNLYSQATTKSAALGFTIHLLYADEFAHIPEHIVVPFYRSIYPTLSSSQVSRIIISSTANGMNLFHSLYDGAVHGTNSYAPMRIDWWEVPGRDDEWKKREIANLNGNEELFNQEYGNQFIISSRMLIDDDLSLLIKKQSMKYEWKEIDQLFELPYDYDELRWHPKFDPIDISPSDKFVFAIDIADGIGGDFTIINIFRLECKSVAKIRIAKEIESEQSFFRLRQVGLFRSNQRSVDDVSKLLHLLLFKVFNCDNVRVVMESNFKGDAMYEKISTNPDFYPEIFMHTRHSKVLKVRKPGVKITSENKEMYCRELKKILQQARIVVTELETSKEISAFGINKNGKFEAQTGHDDIAMTLVNLVPYFENETFSAQVEEMWENLSDAQKKAIDVKIEMSDIESNGYGSTTSETLNWLKEYM